MSKYCCLKSNIAYHQAITQQTNKQDNKKQREIHFIYASNMCSSSKKHLITIAKKIYEF